MSIVDERAEISEEKREEQCTDMGTIDVRIRHDNNTMISEAAIVK
jgi:hypothetical protein